MFDTKLSLLALIYYDYALTLPLEIKHVWGRKLCLSTFLYISCRYALLGNVLFLLASAGKLEQGVRTTSLHFLPHPHIIGLPCHSQSDMMSRSDKYLHSQHFWIHQLLAVNGNFEPCQN